jgi:hypothetical protein
MATIIKTWLVIGSLENWETAFAQPIPIWGLKERFANIFQFLSKGDQIAIYVISPVKGIVGFASVKDKYIDYETPIWNEEKDRGKVIWPLRFRLSDLRVLPRQYWEGKKDSGLPTSIDITDFPIFWQKGFHELTDSQAAKIFERARKSWGEEFSRFVVKEPTPKYQIETPKEVTEMGVSLHKKIQESLVEIGRLQFYYPETEFLLPLEAEHKRMDVVWKRELTGVPTFAFEVELSGGLEKAITKLRIAFNKWNSQPRLVIPETQFKSVENLIAREQNPFQRDFRYYQPEIIENLLSKKQDLRSFEQKYGIY